MGALSCVKLCIAFVTGVIRVASRVTPEVTPPDCCFKMASRKLFHSMYAKINHIVPPLEAKMERFFMALIVMAKNVIDWYDHAVRPFFNMIR